MVFLPHSSQATPTKDAPILQLLSTTTQKALGLHLSLFAEPSKKIPFEQIQQPSNQARFVPSKQSIPSYGQTQTSYWVRLRIKREPNAPTKWWLITPRWWLSMKVFLPKPGGGYDALFRHPAQPHRMGPLPYRGFIFPIQLPQNAQKTTTIYIHVYSSYGSLSMPFSLWNPTAFQRYVLGESVLFGLFYGIFLAMFLYNLFLYFSIQERSYLDYVAYTAGVGIYIASYHGIANQYLWPDFPWWNRRAPLFFVGIALFGAMRFIAYFLQTKKYTPIHHKLLLLASNAAFFLIVLSLWNERLANAFSLWLALLAVPTGFSAILQCVFLKQRSAYFVLIGWGLLLLGSLCQSLSLLGYIPLNMVTQFALIIGAILEAILLSFALADRVNAMNLVLEKQSAQLSEQNLALSRLDQLKDQLIANTSHELRTPLNGMIGLTESLLEGSAGPLPEEAVEDLTLIARSSRRLAVLLNDLLDFSRLRQQRFKLEAKPTSVIETVELVLALSLPQAHNKHIQLLSDIPEDLPAVLADENRLQQILHNLIGNAIKFTNNGHIKVSAQPKDGYVSISITDSGLGIKSEDQERIFRSFEQVDGSSKRAHDGLGLGLAITKQLVELQGGTISVSSTLGQGSSFTFTLPISEEPAASSVHGSLHLSRLHTRITQDEIELPLHVATPDPKHAHDSLELATEETVRPIKLLVVDDDPVNLRVLQRQLDTPRYQLSLASSGEQALQKIEDNGPFDLILLDIMMPNMTGYEVTQKLREQHNPSELPIIMLTAKNQVNDLITAFQSGANDYISKPYAKGELIARIQHQLSSEK
ncbi:MAG: response regulator [Myxococcales bacterium]|nr:response regulator [Myxococcales bacterium]MCB9641462.1 response regulator [Myxococcales bacterium]